MADVNVEKLKEKLYQVANALFCICETLVDESKMHISEHDALVKICSCMQDTDVIGSRLRVDQLIEDCIEPAISDWMREYLNVEQCETNFPSCCDGCSNNPKNGGSGICNCTLPYMQNPIMYDTNDSIDDCCMASNIDGRAFTVNKDFLDQISKMKTYDIDAAVERIKKYVRE